MSGAHPLEELARVLCRVFLGWRLREDYDALLALGEGSLRVDLLRGEAWCDGEPIPPLFIAGELRAALHKGLAAEALPADALREAVLEAEFAARRPRGRPGPPRALALACRVRLVGPQGAFTAEANNAGPGV
ncbi:MAG: hypothetical protein R3263_04870 [Myxococcota bacterium]|nr:hypothetical protein [Myxococcota bacterium]